MLSSCDPPANFDMGKTRVVDPDPDWIRIQSGLWIRICIRNPDPDPGGQKLPTKVEKKLLKFMF